MTLDRVDAHDQRRGNLLVRPACRGELGHAPDIPASFGSPNEVGKLFLTDHLLAFEVTSIVLLAAAVGGVVLGSQASDEEAAQ